MSLVIYKEKLKAVVSKPWSMEGNSGVSHFMQTEFTLPDGQFQIRKIKIKEEMLPVANKLKEQLIDVVITNYSKLSAGKPFTEFAAIQPPTLNRGQP